jgi:hypothetical protein
MTDRDSSMAGHVEADIQDAVNALLDASKMTRVRAALPREQRREFLMQEAELEAQLLEHEGHEELAGQLRRVAKDLRVLQPKVVATGQGDA